MEHVLQIGINVDDDKIQEAAVNQAAKQLTKSVEERMFERGYNDYYKGFTSEFVNVLAEVVDKHKDEIIREAAVLVADTIKRSKKYKAVLAALGGEEEG